MDNIRENETFMSKDRMLQRKLHLAQDASHVYPGLQSSWSQGLNSGFSLSMAQIIEWNMGCLPGIIKRRKTLSIEVPNPRWGAHCRGLGLSADMVDEAKSTTCGVKIRKYLTDPADTGRLNTLSISQGLGIFSCKGPGDKYFSPCRLHTFAIN